MLLDFVRTAAISRRTMLLGCTIMLLVSSIGCLDEGANRDGDKQQFTNNEYDDRYENSGRNSGNDNHFDSNTGINPCGGEGPLFYDGQHANPQDSCGACDDGVLSCTAEGALECVGATPSNACGGCGELTETPGERCGEGLIWTCDSNNHLECAPPEGQEVVFVSPDFEDIDAHFDITSTSATFNAGVSRIATRAGVIDHGFCWGTVPEPAIELSQEDEDVLCDSLGALNEAGEFVYNAEGLLPGRRYYVRAFVSTENNTYYAEEVSFVTAAPAVEDVFASQSEYEDKIVIRWTAIDGAVEYVVYRDGEEVGRATAPDSVYDDNSVEIVEIAAPANVHASDEFIGRIDIRWEEPEASLASSYIYTVQVVYPDATSEQSEEASGSLLASDIIGYEVNIKGVWQDVGLLTSYSDLSPDLNAVSNLEISASQYDHYDHIVLSLDSDAIVEPIANHYRVRARTTSGVGQESEPVIGYVSFGNLSYQWERSPSNDDSQFVALDAAISSPHADMAIDAGMSEYYYRLLVYGPGIEQTYSETVLGKVAMIPEFDDATLDFTVVNNQVTMSIAVGDLGLPLPEEMGFCFGTMVDPTDANGAECVAVDVAWEDIENGVLSAVYTGVSSGTTYFARPYSVSPAGIAYGEVGGFEVAPSAPGIQVTNQVNSVKIDWTAVDGASSYAVYRDGELIATVAANVTEFSDTNLASAPVPAAPHIHSISKGGTTDGVLIQWSEVVGQPGPTHDYTVVAISENGTEGVAASATGGLLGRTVTGYQIKIGEGSWQNVDIGDGLTFLDLDAPHAQINVDEVAASQQTSEEYVEVSITLDAMTQAIDQSYQLRAMSAAGKGIPAQASGYRGHSESYTYQWYYSDTGNPEDFAQLNGATTATYQDVTAPEDGATRYYYVEISAPGAQTIESSVISGARIPGVIEQCLDLSEQYDPSTAVWPELLGEWVVEIPCSPNDDDPSIYQKDKLLLDVTNDFVRIFNTSDFFITNDCSGPPALSLYSPSAPQAYIPQADYVLGDWVDPITETIRPFDAVLGESSIFTEIAVDSANTMYLVEPRGDICGWDADNRCTFDGVTSGSLNAIPFQRLSGQFPDGFDSPLCIQKPSVIEGKWRLLDDCDDRGDFSIGEYTYAVIDEESVTYSSVLAYHDSADCSGDMFYAEEAGSADLGYFISEHISQAPDIFALSIQNPALFNGLDMDPNGYFHGLIRFNSDDSFEVAQFDPAEFGDLLTMCGLSNATRCTDFSHSMGFERVQELPAFGEYPPLPPKNFEVLPFPMSIPCAGTIAIGGPSCFEDKTYAALEWDDSAGAERYNIYRCDSNIFCDQGPVLEIEADDFASYTDAIMQGEYYYWISASNSAGESILVGPESINTVEDTEAPLNFSAYKKVDGVLLTWLPPEDGIISGYDVARCDLPQFCDGEALIFSTSDHYIEDTSLTEVDRKHYWVRAVRDDSTTSEWIGPIDGWLKPNIPQNFSIGEYNQALKLSWSGAEIIDNWESVYRITRCDTSSYCGSTGESFITYESEYWDTTVGNGEEYYYWVEVKTRYDKSELAGPISGMARINKPVGVTVDATTSTVDIGWITVPGAVNYSVYRDTIPTFDPLRANAFTTLTNSYGDTSVVGGESYYYWVQSHDNASSSDMSGPYFITAQDTGSNAPGDSADYIDISSQYDPSLADWSDLLGTWSVSLGCEELDDEPGTYFSLTLYTDISVSVVRSVTAATLHQSSDCDDAPTLEHFSRNAPRAFMNGDDYHLGDWVDMVNNIREIDIWAPDINDYERMQIQLLPTGNEINIAVPMDEDDLCGGEGDRCELSDGYLTFTRTWWPDTGYEEPLYVQQIGAVVGSWIMPGQCYNHNSASYKVDGYYEFTAMNTAKFAIIYTYFDDIDCSGDVIMVTDDNGHIAIVPDETSYFIGDTVASDPDIYEFNFVSEQLNQSLDMESDSLFNTLIKFADENELHIGLHSSPINWSMCGLRPANRCTDIDNNFVQLYRVESWPSAGYYPPFMPENVRMGVGVDGRYLVEWDQAPGAAGYNIYVCESDVFCNDAPAAQTTGGDVTSVTAPSLRSSSDRDSGGKLTSTGELSHYLEELRSSSDRDSGGKGGGAIPKVTYYWVEAFNEYGTSALAGPVSTEDICVGEMVTFNDAVFEAYIRAELGIPMDTIYCENMADLSQIDISNMGVNDLTGIEYAINLESLNVDVNNITDISPLSQLTKLRWILLANNNISDISVMANLTELTSVNIWNNPIDDISVLSGLTNLTSVLLGGTDINDFSPLANLVNLTFLEVGNSQLDGLDFVENMTQLQTLNAFTNNIVDINVLANLTALTDLNLQNNCLDLSDSTTSTIIADVVNRGGNVNVANQDACDSGSGSYTECEPSDPDFTAGPGDGSLANPYQICSPFQLNAIGDEYPDSHFIITADLDMLGVPSINMIGSQDTPFVGSIDGNGYSISNVYISESGAMYVGLVSYAGNGASFSNIVLEDVNIVGNNSVGGLIGFGVGITISNSHVSGTVESSTGTVGGLAGFLFTGTVIQSSSSAEIIGSSINIGGLVGCLCSGGSITESFATGNVTTNIMGNSIGGLAGHAMYASITDSYSTGIVVGDDKTGGLVGYAMDSAVARSYTTSAVSGNTDTGPLIGYMDNNSSMDDSYYINGTECAGCTNNDGDGLDYEDAISQDDTFYSNFDFVLIWEMVGCGTPRHYWDDALYCCDPAVEFTQGPGDGSEDNPYQLCSASHLQSIGDDSSLMNKHFAMVDDIDLNHQPFNMIASQANIFTGIFHGNNYRISNLYIDEGPGSEAVGLFRVNGGTIKNVGLVDVNVDGDTYVGALAGGNIGTIINSYSHGQVTGTEAVGGLVGVSTNTIATSYSEATVAGAQSAGGLVGTLSTGTITQSYAIGTVLSGINNTGGLVGNTSGGSIIQSYAAGSVVGQEHVGGLIGWIGESAAISYSDASGDVVGDVHVGGLVGASEGAINNSFATGNVNGNTSNVGGFIGGNLGDIIDSYAYGNVTNMSGQHKGGFVGWNSDNATIARCFATGDVEGELDVGGFVGGNTGEISDSYANGDVVGDQQLLGGFVGWNGESGVIRTSYSVGGVQGPGSAGYFVGGSDPMSSISDSYYNSDASCVGCTHTNGDQPLSYAQLVGQDSTPFLGFDFGATWEWIGCGAPKLQWAELSSCDFD